jgi:branched-chain amino acid transport system substrate-binding protein
MGRAAIVGRVCRGAATVALAGLVLTGCGDDGNAKVEGGTLLVYMSVPRSGPNAAAGRDEADGARLALSQAGGLSGKDEVRLKVLDSAEPAKGGTTPRQVAVNARAARRDKRTVAYLGETDPAASAVSVVILNSAGVLQVSPSDTFAGLTHAAGAAGEPDRYYPRMQRTFARILPNDQLQARATARWMHELGFRRLLLLDDDRLYGRSLAERVGEQATKLGLKVVDEQAVDPRPGKLAQQLLGLAPLRPDVVFLGADAGPEANAAWAALAAGLPNAARFGSGTLDVPSFTSGAASGRIVAPGRIRIDPAFARAFRARYGRPASLDAASAQAAMRGALGAIAAVPGSTPTRAEVARAIHGLHVSRSAVGPYAILPSGDSTLRGTAGIAIADGQARTVRGFRLP